MVEDLLFIGDGLSDRDEGFIGFEEGAECLVGFSQ